MRLLNNSEAINGVLLVINAAISSVNSTNQTTNFNSARGLKAQTFLDLILGFHAAFVATIYTESAQKLAKNILYIASTKKIMAFSTANVTELKSQRTFLKDVIQIIINTRITEIQTEIKTNGTVETTVDDIEKLIFPIPTKNETGTESSLTKVQILTLELQALLANLDALQITIKSVNTAISSNSSSGIFSLKFRHISYNESFRCIWCYYI